eukprot:CAMPEP_0196596192 /NCGR_PEP_ID=MMETSP1081-20130531/84706_1 /TAXON_ID=36882 /ORGANISM="Pyramimonas amylifera, Strain CCMP720" /LENGTH=43 /DNA_ID= /DNA_START= /DNA_END= /DNA_ORIENTATION=
MRASCAGGEDEEKGDVHALARLFCESQNRVDASSPPNGKAQEG